MSLMYLIDKRKQCPTDHLNWGFMSHMNRCNRKLIFRTDSMDESISSELDDGDLLAAHDGNYGYLYEDVVELKRKL